MANEKPISKGYLLTQLKNYETEIINKKYIEKEDGKGLSSNDYTTEEKNKLAGLENYNDTALSNRVKSVEDEVPNLATKTYVGEQVANAEHLKREIVNVLPSDTKASDNIIYMLKVESTTGNDKYQEYMKIDGTVQMVGDTSVDLTDYAKSTDIPTTVAQLTDSASYAKKTEIPTTLPANGGNADTVNNHTVETDVPTDAKFTDTVYDDTEVKESIDELNSNLVEQKMLGWTVPSECPIQNYVDSDGVFHQRVGRVDLGSLEWIYDDSKNGFYVEYSKISKTSLNMYCSNFKTIASVFSWSSIELYEDNSIGTALNGYLYAKSTQYTDATTFKNSMQGVYLYYELAEEILIKVDGNEAVYNLQYDVDELKQDLDVLTNYHTEKTLIGKFCGLNHYRNVYTGVINNSSGMIHIPHGIATSKETAYATNFSAYGCKIFPELDGNAYIVDLKDNVWFDLSSGSNEIALKYPDSENCEFNYTIIIEYAIEE